MIFDERGRYTRLTVEQMLRDWVMSAPMRALAEASGWHWPDGTDTQAVLDRLAELSSDWDFRNNRERDRIEPQVAVAVNGRQIDESVILDAARAFGMADASEVAKREFSHLVVLSGLVRACVNRTHHAAGLIRDGLAAEKVVVLGAHRMLAGGEIELAREAGLGDFADEAEVILAATQRAFGLGTPLSSEEPQSAPVIEQPELFHAASARYRWPSVEVVIAPSSEPMNRRANTPDQLRHWADEADLGSEHDVLILTTQIYVPYQHLETVRILGLERGCGVYSCGVNAATALLPGRRFCGRDYLQETRSALLTASALLRVASNTRAGAPDRGRQS